MTTPMTPAGMPQADQAPMAQPTPQQFAPAPKKSRLGAAVVGGAAVTALLGGAIGGAVGYTVASNNSTPTVAIASSESGAVGANLASATGNTVVDLAAAVQPAVVQLDVSGGSGSGTGSGFVISPDGYIVTNNHVAGPAGKDGSINVTFADGKTATGKLVGASPDYDLAVVKVDRTGLDSVPMGVSRDLKVGQSVIAIGSPLGLQGTVTTGIVSALDRPVTAGESQGDTSFINAIQTDAAINPGNSGGPLINAAGEVIGVNSAIASMGSSAGQAGSIGLGFAIPIDRAMAIANQIRSGAPAPSIHLGDSAFIGVGIADAPALGGPPGAVVRQVLPDAPAAQIGLRPGDVITMVDGTPVNSAADLSNVVDRHRPGDTVMLTWIDRMGNPRVAPVMLGKGPVG
jgi:putative serine protease PepD